MMLERRSGPRHKPATPWLVVILAALAVVGIAAGLLYQEYRTVLANGEARANALSLIASTHIHQTISAIEVSMQSLDGDMSAPGINPGLTPEEMQRTMARINGIVPALQGIGIVDRDGNLVANVESGHPKPLNLSDRPFYQFHRNNAAGDLLIGHPIISRPQGVLGIPVSQRIDDIADAGGDTFAGAIAGRISPKYLVSFFEALGADAASLRLADGTILARFPEIDLINAAPAPFAADRTTDISPTFTESDSKIDGVRRLTSLRRVGAMSLYVTVGLDRDALFAEWRGKRDVGMALTTLICLLMVGGAYFTRKRAADAVAMTEMAAHVRAEAAARHQADEVSRSKSEFLSHMSHELRTPLNAILGFSEVIKDQSFGPVGQPKYAEYADDIHYSASHLLSVINNILDLSKVESGRWQINDDEVRLEDLIDALIRLSAERARRESVIIAVRGAPSNCIIRGDRRTLLQIMLNVTINAIKFSGSNHAVDVTAERLADGGLEIAITDYGDGMSPEDIDQAMRPYETPASHVSRAKQDTGLGLPLAAAFAEMHGGKLTLHSAPGRGTTARLRLPPHRIKLAA